MVGSPAARAVHGHSAGGQAVVLGGSAGKDASGAVPAALAPAVEAFDLSVVGAISRGADLGVLADVAGASDTAPLVLLAADLQVTPVALLDVLDRPGDASTLLMVDRSESLVEVGRLTPLRVDRDLKVVVSVGTSRHSVTNPNVYAAGVVRIAGHDRERAAAIWRTAAETASAADPEVDPFDLAVLALVRASFELSVVDMGPFDLRRGAGHVRGAPGSPWQQRLRGASRRNDGWLSTTLIRPLSRRVTRIGLEHDWSPNVVTVVSLGLGLVASALACLDIRWAWAAAAVLLQVALVVDCVDGEIARFARRFSPFGAWLDAVGDRIKEYSLLAAVAWVGARRGEPVWLVAVLVMGLITMRHLEDYAYADRLRFARPRRAPDPVELDEPRDLGPADAPVTVPGPPSPRRRAIYWFKKVMHLPIAERYLLLSVGLLTFSVDWFFGLIGVCVVVAVVWTQGGRTVKALLRRDAFRAVVPGTTTWRSLDHELDLGPLGRGISRLARVPSVGAWAGLTVVLAGLVLAWVQDPTDLSRWAVVAIVAAGLCIVAACCAPPVDGRLAWQLPAVAWMAEVLVVVVVGRDLDGSAAWAVFAYAAAVAWHRYDVVYRLRDTGRPPHPLLGVVTLGFDGRIVVLGLVWAAGGPVAGVLAWGALLLAVVFVAESAHGWYAWASERDEAARMTAAGATA